MIKPWTHHPTLTPGSRVRDRETGQVYRVGRVTACSASLHAVYASAREVSITRRDGTVDTFMATESGSVLQVSPRAAMELLED